MPAGRTSAQTGLAVSRGREGSRSLLVTPRSGGLCTRQTDSSTSLGRQCGSRQQHGQYDAQDKTHDGPLFFASTREGVFRMHRARAFPARLGCGALHRQRFAPLSRPQVEPTPQRARPICPASVSAPKAGRPINTSMSGSKPKPVPCSETSSMARKCPARVHRERVHGRSSLAYPVTASSPTSETSRAPMLPVTMLCKSGR